MASTCHRCGRPLKTRESQTVGYGPSCLKKVRGRQQRLFKWEDPKTLKVSEFVQTELPLTYGDQ